MEVVMIGNEKGGVGKTTLTRCLSEALTQLGYRTLMVDWDPSGNLSDCTLEVFPEYVLFDIFQGACTIEQLTVKTDMGDILPTVRELNLGKKGNDYRIRKNGSKSLTTLASRFEDEPGRETKLRRFLADSENKFRDRYDFVLIDTPSSDCLLTTNAIVAASSVLLVLEPSREALSGIWKVISSINTVRNNCENVYANIDGVVIANYSKASENSAIRDSLAEISRTIPAQNIYLYRTMFRNSAHIAGAKAACSSLMKYVRNSCGNGIPDMFNLALEFLASRALEPRTIIPGLHKGENGNWYYATPKKDNVITAKDRKEV